MMEIEQQIERLLREAPDEVQQTIVAVYQLEKEHLHLKQPHLRAEIAAAIKKAVK